MGDFRTHTRAFNGGEVTPEFFGRIDDAKYQTGLALCRNFVVRPHGPVRNRNGTFYVREVRSSAFRVRLFTFEFSFDQMLVVEFSPEYFRFHAYGQTVLNIFGQPYELAHPYLEAEIPAVQITQSGDVVTLTHRNHPPRELRRLAADSWQIVDIAFAPSLPPPTGVAGAATPGSTPGTPFLTEYCITALAQEGDESLRSATVSVSNNLYDDGAFNTLTWAATAGAARYNVYKRSNGLFGFIGQTDLLTFKDENIAADIGRTPPLSVNAFNSPGNYPGAVSYHDQRRVFAGTLAEPQKLWFTRAGTESNLNYSIPPQDADSIQFRIASRQRNTILHLLPMGDMVVLTQSGVWRVDGGEDGVLTPLTVSARQQGGIGSAVVPPVLADNTALYVSSRGGHVRELGYSDNNKGYVSGDVSIRAPHLFDGRAISRLAMSVSPDPTVWAVSSNGALLGLTYVPEQQVGAWHQHTTAGVFEDVTTTVENGEDVLYFVVCRDLMNRKYRCIERMPLARATMVKDAHHVDCGAVYTGLPANTVSGLDWLEGEEVAILADGAVLDTQVVVDGKVHLEHPARVVHVGLPFTSDLQTLPIALEISGYAQGQPKNVNEVFLGVYESSGIFAGPSFDELREFKQRTTEPAGTPPNPVTGTADIRIDGGWGFGGQVCVRQVDPLPLTITSITLDIAVGGG